jgi:cytochrome c5
MRLYCAPLRGVAGEADVSGQDRRFFDTFAIVLGGIVVFTVVIYFIAQVVAGDTQEVWAAEEHEQSADLEARIAPVGTVAVAGETPEAAPAAPPAADAGADAQGAPAAAVSGEEVYNGTCFACHAVGVAGAPKLGDKADWEPRIAQGMDTLVQHAVQGYQGSKGIMPPKGGRADLSDEAVAAAVEFMAGQGQ